MSIAQERSVRELELDAMLGSMPIGIIVVEGNDARAVYANPQASYLVGRPILGSRCDAQRSWYRRPDGSSYSLDELPALRALRGEQVNPQEMHLVLPDARTRCVEVYAAPLRNPRGEQPRAVLGLWDVTRRRRAEEQLLLKLSELETALAAVPDVYFRIDATGTILDARSGRTSSWTVEQLIGKHLRDAFASEVLARVERAVKTVLGSGSLATLEYQRGPVDDPRWHEIRTLPLSQRELVLIVRDVSELKRAQEQQRAREQRFRAIFNSTFQFIGLLDPNGNVLEANDTALDFIGARMDDVAGKPFWETPWWTAPAAQAELRRAVDRARAGEFVRYRTSHVGVGGRVVELDFSLKPVRDELGKVVLLLPEGRDITESEAARRALAESEERFRTAMEFAPIGMALIRLDGRFLKVNCALRAIVGYSEAELLARSLREITHPEDADLDAVQAGELARGGVSNYHVEKRYVHRDGHPVWVCMSIAMVRTQAGAPKMLVAEIQDTSEARSHQEQLLQSVAEKEVLLREIHHRVKNNLQVISSILRMQGEQSSSAEMRGMFHDSQMRIQTMALIHDRLCRSENLASIDFGAHLRDLSNMVVRLFGQSACAVRVELAVDALSMNLDTAIPLGLLANELITNAMKHAFVGRARGTLSIALQRRARVYRLTVADDGVGFPPDFDMQSSRRLGMRMIWALARQLQGELALERDGRNAVIFTAPIAEASAPLQRPSERS